MAVSQFQHRLPRKGPNLRILLSLMCFFSVYGSFADDPIIYSLVPSAPWFENKAMQEHNLQCIFPGIPFIAAGFCFYHHKPANATFHFVSSVGACLLSLVHTPLKEKLSIVVSSLAVIGILLVTFINSNFSASAGALAYGLASAVKSTNFLGLPGVDWFHYVLAVANLLLMFGLIK